MSPQLENGYLKIANEIIDILQKTYISNAEMRILLTVFRHTYGWNKKIDQISLTQFEQETGLTRRGVCKAIGSLVSKRILGREQTGTSNTSLINYWFEKDYEKWLKNWKKRSLGNKRVKTREQIGKTLGNKQVITISTKDIIQKTIQKTDGETPPQTKFLESFSGLYERATGHPFKADKKHFIIISNLIKKYEYEAVVQKTKLLALYCQQGEVWFAKEGWSCFTPETLSAHWNRIIPILSEEQKKAKKSEEIYQKLKEDRRKADELVKDSLAV